MLFDTRYFWAVFTSKSPEEMSKLKALLEKSKSAFASSVTIFEVYKLTLAGEGRAVAKLRADTIEREFDVIDVDKEIAEQGAEISHKLHVPMTDALIMATSKRLRLPCVTDDPHFSEVKKVWV
ncbi:MAG: PIN domain-containing protein [Nitrososphaerota archaeon]|nr:PIN domain-containing protein [Nitrososphaerota archaeon]MDG6918661.1 PIN domain-containing protein [Nitrososphaerota archaeon]MDG6946718.1 PIN domain-containing protein [Nitrososphaerota archaeon]